MVKFGEGDGRVRIIASKIAEICNIDENSPPIQGSTVPLHGNLQSNPTDKTEFQEVASDKLFRAGEDTMPEPLFWMDECSYLCSHTGSVIR
jgi:hypothetical protein